MEGKKKKKKNGEERAAALMVVPFNKESQPAYVYRLSTCSMISYSSFTGCILREDKERKKEESAA